MESFLRYFKQSKSVNIILLSIIINGIGGLIGQFITLILKNDLNFKPLTVSIIVTVSTLSTLLGNYLGGKLCDKYSPRRIKYLSSMTFGIINIIIAFIGANIYMIPLLILGGFVIGLSGATNSLLIYIHAEPDDRKNAFSLVYTAINIAAALAPIIAANVHKYYGFFLLFFLDGLTTILSSILVMLLKEKTVSDKKVKNKEKINVSVLKILRDNKAVLYTLITMALYFVMFAQIKSVLAFQVSDTFNLTWRKVWSVMLTINAVICIILPPIIRIVFQKAKTKNLIMLNGVLYIIGFFMYALTKNQYVFYLSTIIWSVGEVFGALEFEVYMAENSPATHKGRILSLNPLMRKAGQVLGILLGGVLCHMFGTNYLVIWAVLCICPLLGVGLIKISHKEN